ncbi:hypothetical protein [Paenibacillus cremeus]|uniref:Uncharacterized protein n=1 Tax=Paenibacillus cremeus TaxID=2163881 RepID=A0A559KBM1_9BACL|nr:hypothetical protein [Paenibacillus cremeus]TVY09527.1 hypothetical protein FPZ49_12330 [Paenibacillus cremeus]
MATPKKNVRIQLSPPQNIYFSKVLNSVGNDPLVQVEPLQQVNNEYLMTIRVSGDQKASAIATLMVLNKKIGNIQIRVQVRNQRGQLINPIRRTLTAAEIAALFRTAFRTNRLFNNVVVRSTRPVRGVFPVFRARVVQFFADNLADLNRNLNFVAFAVFRDVLRNSISSTAILFSTAQKK